MGIVTSVSTPTQTSHLGHWSHRVDLKFKPRLSTVKAVRGPVGDVKNPLWMRVLKGKSRKKSRNVSIPAGPSTLGIENHPCVIQHVASKLPVGSKSGVIHILDVITL